MFKSFLIFLYFLLYLFESTVFGFSTHSTTIFRSFDKDEAVVGESIVVTVSFVNEDAYELRGFYYAEQIPDGLSVNTSSVKIDGSTISNYVGESGSSGDVYPDFVPYRWVFETPTIFFAENNPISSGSTVEIVYSISSSQAGAFNLDEFNWVGYYQDALAGMRAAFGHSENVDKQTITFTDSTMRLPEIIGTWSRGIWCWDVAASSWIEMISYASSGDIAAGDFSGDGKADVASIWSNGLWYQDGDTLAWTQIDSSPPFRVTAGDVTGDGRDEVIGTWDNGIWYFDFVASTWTQMTSYACNGDLSAGDFSGDGRADVASSWGSDGLWYQDGATLAWTKIDSSPPYNVTAGDVTGD
jgi:hypothetical protein